MIALVVYFFLLLFVVYLSMEREKFNLLCCDRSDQFPGYVEIKDAEFRGINMLGVNSTDGFIPKRSVCACREKCTENQQCKGYSYYWPGQRCYIFKSGDFVLGRPGFTSGKKLSYQ